MPARRALWSALLGLIGLGAVALGVGAASSLGPSRAVVPPYIEVELRSIEPGSFVTVAVRSHPYAVVRVTPELVNDLRALTANTWSQRPVPEPSPRYFVFSLVSTNRGCGLVHAPKGKPPYGREVVWLGGFYDPCHYGEWDYAGRAVRRTLQLEDLATPKYSEFVPGTLRFVE